MLCTARFDRINFYQNRPKIVIFFKKIQNFWSVGAFFRPKTGDLKTKKKVCTKIQAVFSAKQKIKKNSNTTLSKYDFYQNALWPTANRRAMAHRLKSTALIQLTKRYLRTTAIVLKIR